MFLVYSLSDIISDGDYLRAIDLGRIEGESVAGRMLSPEEIAALLATCGSAPIDHELPHRPGHRPKEMRPAIPSNGVGVGGPKGLEE